MKANVAPEKLYLHPTANGKVGASWLTFPLTNEDVEYIQTDVFIENACAWLENNLQGIVGGSIYIEDFKKYMKGENV